MTGHDSNSDTGVLALLQDMSTEVDVKNQNLAVILGAGHGKRIKSETSKMLHEVWGVPTVKRVAQAAAMGLNSQNQVVVVGIKAREVAEALGSQPHRIFALQSEQRGTGHALQMALERFSDGKLPANVFVFPGDMGLLNASVVMKLGLDFQKNKCDMMVLTGVYQGDPTLNYYGRIIRVPAKTIQGADSGNDQGKVVEIKEHKDLLALPDNAPYMFVHNGRRYAYSKEELLNIREFNTGVYAFHSDKLVHYISEIRPDNVQGELYVTDLIEIFNKNGLSVRATPAADNKVVLGFNVKSVLKEMESIARERVYDRLKDIVTIQDKDDFFIADEVVEQIEELDRSGAPLDIVIGKGAFIGQGVRLSKGVVIHNQAYLEGNVHLDERVQIHNNVHMSTYPHQVMKVGENTEVCQGDIVKGPMVIGRNARIESSVNMTGSDEYPTQIGNNVLIKGTSYIFGCQIEDDVWIEHSVLKCKYVERTVRKDGTVQPIRWVMPLPEGLDSIDNL